MLKKTILILLFGFLILYLIRPDKAIITTQSTNYKMDDYLKNNDSTILFGLLEIPVLNLHQPLYQPEQKENHVDKNVMILESTENFLALASHSGNGPHAYFRTLDKLKLEDKIIIKTHENQKEYQYFKKEEVKKTGTILLENYDFSYLVLITCSKTNDKIQEVYYAKLTKIY
jgi:LPXTG-site transpeptidase (sortase) family protein